MTGKVIAMKTSKPRTVRQGATTVEFALVASLLFLLVFGLITGGLGVFRYFEVAHLAREGARYASTHGGWYTRDGLPTSTGVPAIASSQDLTNVLTNEMVLLDPNSLNVSVSWSSPTTLSPRNLPQYLDPSYTGPPSGQVTYTNYVTVTVTYQWLPEVYLVGPITMSSTCTLPMSY
jgi:Flp pilus assembly protein TadG